MIAQMIGDDVDIGLVGGQFVLRRPLRPYAVVDVGEPQKEKN